MIKEKNKILLLTPAETAKGGISSYFKSLENKWSIPIEYFERGARTWPLRKGMVREHLRAIRDLNRFIKLLKKDDYSMVQASTSLGINAMIRDGIFLRYARKRGLKTIVFFRGWDENVERLFRGILLPLFRYLFFQCDTMIVLSQQFKDKLISWGYRKLIYVETTVVDDELLAELNDEYLEERISTFSNSQITLLFLARIEKAKGIYEALEAFKDLKVSNPGLKLTIAGDGFELDKIRQEIENLGIEDIHFTGFVRGKEKSYAFRDSHIFLFPSYTEGMPNAVLEAMAFGLPVITTPVGGLVDFFQDGVHGYYIKKNNGKEIAQITDNLIEDHDAYKRISMTNWNYSRSVFFASVVVKRLEAIYLKTLS